MNGAHDLGGKHGFAEIDRSQHVNFKQQWEEKVFSMTLACGMLGKWNLDQSRFARERVDPAEYLAGSYYEHWLHGLESLLVENGLISEDELRNGLCDPGTESNISAVDARKVDHILSNGGPTELASTAAAKLSIGDKVVVRVNNTDQHTRAPGYVQGKPGRLVSHYGSHIFSDVHAATGQKQPEHLYCVRFEACDLWGENSVQRSAVYLDLFEPYLISLEQHVNRLVNAGPA